MTGKEGVGGKRLRDRGMGAGPVEGDLTSQKKACDFPLLFTPQVGRDLPIRRDLRISNTVALSS